MKNKRLIFGISAIVLVIAIFTIAEKLNTISPPEHRTKFFPHIEERSITSLVITEGENSVTLHRDNGSWMVSKTLEEQTFSADSASAQIAVEKIVSMRKGDLISNNPANQSTFEVDDTNSLSVQIFTSKSSTAAGILHIGKTGPDWNSNYVRKCGTDAVYAVPGGLRHSLFLDIERWRAKETVPVD